VDTNLILGFIIGATSIAIMSGFVLLRLWEELQEEDDDDIWF